MKPVIKCKQISDLDLVFFFLVQNVVRFSSIDAQVVYLTAFFSHIMPPSVWSFDGMAAERACLLRRHLCKHPLCMWNEKYCIAADLQSFKLLHPFIPASVSEQGNLAIYLLSATLLKKSRTFWFLNLITSPFKANAGHIQLQKHGVN